ncbi:MAG TPA: N-acetylmuramic acid 6-phosphate etherase [Planctomycetes bacterium]|nr:N-acetylmuramic acid 6-phosphate etherase [Planctomycetota bacterium]
MKAAERGQTFPWEENRGTEALHPKRAGLDIKPTEEVVALLWQDQLEAVKIVEKALPQIAAAAKLFAQTLRMEGRVFYVGAGSSGRLGALDAVELPPTFSIEPARVQAILAGGERAFVQALEEEEDNYGAGKEAIRARRVTSSDLVIAISASGGTPFVLGAISEARLCGAKTVGITNNHASPLGKAVDLSIVVPTGPELVAGSTRLKAGTAQKVVLNLLSTAAMIALGKVYEGLMVDVKATNEKLKARAESIVAGLTETPPERVKEALAEAGWRVKPAVLMLKGGIGYREAEGLLKECGGSLRAALGKIKNRRR